MGASTQTLLKAWQSIGEHPEIELKELSSPYKSAPVGMDSENWFTNAVGLIQTNVSAYQLLKILLLTEKSLGRDRAGKPTEYQDRTVDLDLLYFGKAVQADPDLTLPHPRLTDRLFVLAPLVSIAPDFIDPQKKVSIAALHKNLMNRIKKREIAQQEISVSAW